MATKPSGPIKPTTAASKEQVQPRSFLRDDVPVIRKAAIMFAICLLLGAALVGVSQYFLAKLSSLKRKDSTRPRPMKKMKSAIFNRSILNWCGVTLSAKKSVST
jgi:hypothetical protein